MKRLLLLLVLLPTVALAQHGPQLGSGGTTVTYDAETNNIGHVYTVTSATYSPNADDYIILVDTDETVTITLPTAVTIDGRIVHIKDSTGGAFTYPITVATQSTATIDGETSTTIPVAYMSLSLVCDGTNWFLF